MSFAKSVSSANAEYVKSHKERRLSELPMPPGKKAVVVTCMDARLNPAAFLGISEGDCHVIRNAGATVRDSVRSILISQHLLQTEEILVIYHTGCGILTFTTEQFQSQLKAKHPAHAKEIESIDFLTYPDLESALKSDVEFLRQHPLLAHKSNITGWVFEVETGKVRQVVV